MSFISLVLTPSNPACYNGCNGSITAAVTGGIAPYQWQWYKNGVPFATTKDIFNLCPGTYQLVVTDSVGGFNGVTKIYDMVAANGSLPQAPMLLASDGNYYGLTGGGGNSSFGVIFKWDGTTYTKLFDFDGTAHGKFPAGGLIQVGTNLYGTCSQGGAHGQGTIFSYNIITNVITILYSFNVSPDGEQPYGSLVNLSGTLYGVCRSTGSLTYGAIFKYVISTNTYTKVYDFDNTNGAIPECTLLNVGGILYGTTTTDTTTKGVIFSFNPTGNVYTKLATFSGTGNGSAPIGNLIQIGNRLYGYTSTGGANNSGCLFYYILGGTINNIHDFATATGRTPLYGGLVNVNNILYGVATAGGANSNGVLFSYGTSYLDLFDFSSSAYGNSPIGGLIIGADGNLYGQALTGGTNNAGTLFKVTAGANTATATSVITAPDPIVPHETITAPTCYGSSDGTITVAPTGGTAPYVYQWSTGDTTDTITAPAGTYTLTIGDDNDCQQNFTFTIPQTTPIRVVIEKDLQECYLGNIKLTALASLGVAPYSYSWSNGETTQSIEADADTAYTVTVTDSNGCTTTASVNLPSQSGNFMCCLAERLNATATKRIKGLKVSEKEDEINALLYMMIQAYEENTHVYHDGDQKHTFSNTQLGFGFTGSEKIYQSFVPTIGNIVELVLFPRGGNPAQDIVVSVYTDLSGAPDTVVETVTIPHATWFAAKDKDIHIAFSSSLTIGDTYYFVIELSALVLSGLPFVRIDNTGTYGKLAHYNGSWVTNTGTMMFLEYAAQYDTCLDAVQQESIFTFIKDICGCCGCDDVNKSPTSIAPTLMPIPVIPPSSSCKHYVGTSMPSVTDDSSKGYCAGISTWFVTTTNAYFICSVDSVGAAVWSSIAFG